MIFNFTDLSSIFVHQNNNNELKILNWSNISKGLRKWVKARFTLRHFGNCMILSIYTFVVG